MHIYISGRWVRKKEDSTPGRIKGPKRRIYTPSLQLWLAAFRLPKQEAEHDDLAIQGDGSGSKMTVGSLTFTKDPQQKHPLAVVRLH